MAGGDHDPDYSEWEAKWDKPRAASLLSIANAREAEWRRLGAAFIKTVITVAGGKASKVSLASEQR